MSSYAFERAAQQFAASLRQELDQATAPSPLEWIVFPLQQTCVGFWDAVGFAPGRDTDEILELLEEGSGDLELSCEHSVEAIPGTVDDDTPEWDAYVRDHGLDETSVDLLRWNAPRHSVLTDLLMRSMYRHLSRQVDELRRLDKLTAGGGILVLDEDDDFEDAALSTLHPSREYDERVVSNLASVRFPSREAITSFAQLCFEDESQRAWLESHCRTSP